ncbi:hypothetical protein ABEW34_12340 [Paenibacillus algorifonticola]|uniref:hypothetical protein n=1 Tax=Paenibacillus algorifonticola TaxID=684063 RepID=UPI003D26D720
MNRDRDTTGPFVNRADMLRKRMEMIAVLVNRINEEEMEQNRLNSKRKAGIISNILKNVGTFLLHRVK